MLAPMPPSPSQGAGGKGLRSFPVRHAGEGDGARLPQWRFGVIRKAWLPFRPPKLIWPTTCPLALIALASLLISSREPRSVISPLAHKKAWYARSFAVKLDRFA